jgi:hypothetical protein
METCARFPRLAAWLAAGIVVSGALVAAGAPAVAGEFELRPEKPRAAKPLR